MAGQDRARRLGARAPPAPSEHSDGSPRPHSLRHGLSARLAGAAPTRGGLTPHCASICPLGVLSCLSFLSMCWPQGQGQPDLELLGPFLRPQMPAVGLLNLRCSLRAVAKPPPPSHVAPRATSFLPWGAG